MCNNSGMTFDPYLIQSEELQLRAASIRERIPPIIPQEKITRQIIPLIDLTSLEGSDTSAKITAICQKALELRNLSGSNTSVAAVCFYMPFIGVAKNLLQNTGIRIATVAGGFPSGQLALELKVKEVEYCVELGADEIDVVVRREWIYTHQWEQLFEEVNRMKFACASAKMKVILETGEIADPQLIRKACEISILAGADFLKTSTGKVSPAATPEAFIIMADTIREYYMKTGKMIGIKAAGGINEPEIAFMYLQIVREVLGEQWLTPSCFRIGASRLLSRLLEGGL